MSTQDNNEQLDDYLAGDSRLSTLYQQSSIDGPADTTDAAILAAAKRAVDTKPEAVPSTGYRWLIPASLAAGLALIVSVVVINQSNDAERGTPGIVINSSPVAGPDNWLQKIETLAAENKQTEALSELRAFRQAFPEFEIDEKRYIETKKLESLSQK